MQALRQSLSGGLVAQPSGTHRQSSRRPFKAFATAKQPGDDPRAARLARILRQYEGADVRQTAELQEYVAAREERRGAEPGEDAAPGSSRVLRASLGSRATNEREKAKMERYMPTHSGKQVHNVGLHGEGKECWWALRVKAGREKQVCEGLERMVATFLPPLEPAEEGGEPRERSFETWAPKKTLKVWNPKTEKMGTKVMRYPATYPEILTGGENGGWVALRAVLDKQLYDRMRQNPSFLGWQDVETVQVWGANGKATDYEFPRPCTDEMVDAVKEWENNMMPVEEAAVRAFLNVPEVKPGWEEPSEPAYEQRDRRGPRERDGEDRFEGRGRDREAPASRTGWYDKAAEPAEGGSWYDRSSGSGDGGRRDRQGSGLYVAKEGGQSAPWQERPAGGRGDRYERRDRQDSGGWEDRRQERRPFGDRQEGGERRPFGERREGGGGWEDRRGERRPFGDRQEGGERRRFEDRRESGERQPFGDRRERDGGERRGRDSRERSGSAWFDPATQPAPGGSWYAGGGAAAPDSSADEAAGSAGGAWFGSGNQEPQQQAGGSFGGWFDTAATAFDFGSPAAGDAAPAADFGGSAAAAEAPAAVPDFGSPAAAAGDAGAASGSGWDWGEAVEPQAQPAADAVAAADTADFWGEPATGADVWGEAGGVAGAYGAPSAQPQQRVQRRDGGGRFEGGSDRRGGAFGDRQQRDGGGFADRQQRGDRDRRSGAFGDRPPRDRDGGAFGDRPPRGDRDRGAFGDRQPRGDRDGGAFGDRQPRGDRDRRSDSREGGERPAPAPVNLDWWDSDGSEDGNGFAGVYAPSGASDADWAGSREEPQSQARRSGGGRRRSDDGSASWRDDSWAQEGLADRQREGGSGGEGADAAAAFKPGQEVYVKGGNFADFEGKVIEARGNKVTAELDIFGKTTRVELSPSDLAPGSGTDA